LGKCLVYGPIGEDIILENKYAPPWQETPVKPQAQWKNTGITEK